MHVKRPHVSYQRAIARGLNQCCPICRESRRQAAYITVRFLGETGESKLNSTAPCPSSSKIMISTHSQYGSICFTASGIQSVFRARCTGPSVSHTERVGTEADWGGNPSDSLTTADLTKKLRSAQSLGTCLSRCSASSGAAVNRRH